MKSPLRPRRTAQSGASLMLAVMSLIFLVPMIGLAVDVGMLYVIKARLQGAVDGASLAAARSLNLGQTTAAQATSAKQNAVNWFYANFPAGNWFTNSTLMDTSDTHAHVYDDPVNPNLRHVDVTASSHAPTLFMNWFGIRFTNIVAYGFASRRDVNAMLVLDRSGSMGSSCGSLITAAKTFTGQFSAGRDKIGAISFADNAYLHSVPATTFQTDLGYINSFGTGNGELDTIACAGGTATPQAIALAYNELYKINQPGALNVIVVETDGRPNTVTVNFWDGTTAGIAAGSSCTDANNKTKGQGGFASLAALPAWTAGHAMNVGGTRLHGGYTGGHHRRPRRNRYRQYRVYSCSTPGPFEEQNYNETPTHTYPDPTATTVVRSRWKNPYYPNITERSHSGCPPPTSTAAALLNASYNAVYQLPGDISQPINMAQHSRMPPSTPPIA